MRVLRFYEGENKMWLARTLVPVHPPLETRSGYGNLSAHTITTMRKLLCVDRQDGLVTGRGSTGDSTF